MSFLFTFEGIEGSGKTTQLRRLFAYLQSRGYQTATTREPGGCRISDSIRSLLLDPENSTMASHTELLLYAAARAQHVAEVVRPALKEGKIVLCDRFSDATTAYQGAGRGLDRSELSAINNFAADGLIPDMTLLLDFPVEIGLQRARARNHSDNMESEGRFEQEDFIFHQRVRQGYLDLADNEERFHIVNAHSDEDTVAEQIALIVDRFLAERKMT